MTEPDMVEPVHSGVGHYYCEECERSFQNRPALVAHQRFKHRGYSAVQVGPPDKEPKTKHDRSPRPRTRTEPSLKDLEEQLYELHAGVGWLMSATALPQTGYVMLTQARQCAHNWVLAAEANSVVEHALRKVATGTVIALVLAPYVPVFRAFLVETGRVKVPPPPEQESASERPSAPPGAPVGEAAGAEYAYSAPVGDGPSPY